MGENAKKFQAKHPEGSKADERVLSALPEVVKNGKVSCAAAVLVARRLDVPLMDVGIAIDLQGFCIVACQLGIFGEHGKTIVAATSVSAELERALRASLANGRISCEAVWELAKKMKMSRKEIAQACEALKIKIKPCQLGAF